MSPARLPASHIGDCVPYIAYRAFPHRISASRRRKLYRLARRGFAWQSRNFAYVCDPDHAHALLHDVLEDLCSGSGDHQ